MRDPGPARRSPGQCRSVVSTKMSSTRTRGLPLAPASGSGTGSSRDQFGLVASAGMDRDDAGHCSDRHCVQIRAHCERCFVTSARSIARRRAPTV